MPAVKIRLFESLLLVLAVPSCGPRSAYNQLEHPGEYAALQQADRELAALEAARREMLAKLGDVAATRSFASRLEAASAPHGTLDTIDAAGEATGREALLRDALGGLDAAVEKNPDQAGILWLDRARLLKRANRPGEAMSAIKSSLATQPSFAALHFMRYELASEKRLPDELLERACEALHSKLVLPEDVLGDRDRAEAAATDVVTFLEACSGITATVAAESGSHYRFADWVSPRQQQSYIRIQQAINNQSREDLQESERERAEENDRTFREFCFDRCERAYKECVAPDVGCERRRRACMGECSQDNP